ncbi:transient receptor potential cation channel protein painless-like [Ischnura elegans]|uniref:transient receptor potential cation channel protein painless-like n=1 Tax=Ischnura elegans TaxID=197161 RepID=UPI001ED8A952|nr:transient receptor potential cation channel protein painless-like [Ischnura elegans]
MILGMEMDEVSCALNEDDASSCSNLEHLPRALFDAIDRNDLERFVGLLDQVSGEPMRKQLHNGRYTMLQYTCIEGGHHEFAREILRRKFSPNETGPGENLPPFLLAAEYGRNNVLQMLLDNEWTNLGATDVHRGMQSGLHKVVLMEHRGGENCDHLACMNAMLALIGENERKAASRGLLLNALDFKGNTPLHYAAARLKREVGELEEEMTLQLLRAGSDIGIQNDEEEPAFRRIPADILESFLDECITTNRREPFEKDFALKFKYKFLIPSRARPGGIVGQFNRYVEEPLLMLSQSDDHRRLLKHPILASCIYLMWFRIKWIFYANFSIYAIFVLLMTVYIMDLIGSTSNELEGVCCTSAFMNIMLFVLTTKEFIHIFMSLGKYVKIPINIPKLFFIILSGVLLWVDTDKYSLAQVSSLTLLLMWIELALILGQHPRFITYLIMFKTVAVNFFFFISTYFMIVLAFSFSFYILFHDVDYELQRRYASRLGAPVRYFASPWMTFIKTCLMMLGEFELSSLPFSASPFISQVIFCAFVLLISMVLINLVNGLAVSDTQAIMEKAEIIGYVSQIEVFSQMEAIMLDVPRLFHLFRCFLICRGREICRLNKFGPWGKTVRLGFCGWTHVFWKWKEIEVLVNQGGLIQRCACIKCVPQCINRLMDKRVIKRAVMITSKKGKKPHTLDDIHKRLKNVENLLLKLSNSSNTNSAGEG